MGTTTINLRIPLPLLDEGSYKISIGGQICEIKLNHIQNRDTMKSVLGMEMSGSGKVELKPDHHGIANISEVQIVLPFYVEPISTDIVLDGQRVGPIDDYKTPVQEWCLCYLNRLVDVIRIQTRQYWIPSLSGRDLFINDITESDELGRRGRAMVLVSSGGSTPHIPLQILSQNDASQEIEKMLLDETEISLHQELQLDAVNYFSTGRYNEAVISMHIALEVFVWEYLYSQLQKKYDAVEAKKKIDEVLKTKKFGRILDGRFREITGRSLKDTALWNDFERSRELRRGVVHPNPRKVTKDECQKMIIDVAKIMQWIFQ